MALTTSCTYSKHPIDKDPLVKVDESLFGIRKVLGDSDKANFILVQNTEDKSPPGKKDAHLYYITYFNQSGTNRR